MLVRDQVGFAFHSPHSRVLDILMYRTDELFDIIVDYPDSLAALEDLKVSPDTAGHPVTHQLISKECLAKIDQRDALVTKLKAS